jgi:phospholipid N-methyltransferase
MLKKITNTLKDFLLFSREIVHNPAAMGAALPSSKILARMMAQQLPNNAQGYIVELGAGTGVITQALLDKGIPISHLIVLERSETLFEHLQKRFPDLKIIHGDAVNLQQLLHGITPITAIVSSLPLKSLPKETVATIADQIINSLTSKSLFIHYTYDLRKREQLDIKDLILISSSYIWQNIPPAKIEVYQKA